MPKNKLYGRSIVGLLYNKFVTENRRPTQRVIIVTCRNVMLLVYNKSARSGVLALA